MFKIVCTSVRPPFFPPECVAGWLAEPPSVRRHGINTMKIIIILPFVLNSLLSNSSLIAQDLNQPNLPVANESVQLGSVDDSVTHNPSTSKISEAEREFLTVDVAGFPFRDHDSGTWQPTLSIRVGYGHSLAYPFEFQIFGEYYKFNFDNHDGISYHDYSQGRRRDYAVYSAIVAFGFMEFALGGYYTVQDEVIHRSMFFPQLTIDPVVKKLGLYFHIGVAWTIHIAGPVSCSLGLCWRNPEGNGSTSLGARSGLRVDI